MSKKKQIPQISPEEQKKQDLLSAARCNVELHVGAIVGEWRENFASLKKAMIRDIENSPKSAIEFHAGKIIRLQTVLDLVGDVEHNMEHGMCLVDALDRVMEERVKQNLLFNRFHPNGSDQIHNAKLLCEAEGYSAFYETMRTHVMMGKRRAEAVKKLTEMGVGPAEIQSSIPPTHEKTPG